VARRVVAPNVGERAHLNGLGVDRGLVLLNGLGVDRGLVLLNGLGVDQGLVLLLAPGRANTVNTQEGQAVTIGRANWRQGRAAASRSVRRPGGCVQLHPPTVAEPYKRLGCNAITRSINDNTT
jgi:hypothetical protein